MNTQKNRSLPGVPVPTRQQLAEMGLGGLAYVRPVVVDGQSAFAIFGADGQQIGVVDTREALRQALALDLDLVEVAPQANPPVCRIMDYGKFKYERDVRQKEARRKQSRTGLKEIKFRPKIDPHDYATKKGHVERFLNKKDKVKVTIMFRGREQAHPERGRALLQRLFEDLGDTATIEQAPQQEGRNMHMVLAPGKGAGAAS